MIKKLIRFISLIFGGVIGYQVVESVGLVQNEVLDLSNPLLVLKSFSLYGVVGGAIVGLIIIPFIVELIVSFERRLQKVPFVEIMAGVFGAGIGLILGILLGYAFPIATTSSIGSYLQILINIILAYLGLTISMRKAEDLFSIFQKGSQSKQRREKQGNNPSPKLLDTSVIIDGRIADICKTGFIEGTLIIPDFVLEELRHIADSPDLLKRNRGRRGLDILNQIQKQMNISVEIVESNFDDFEEVDSKLVKLGKIMRGKILTNDFNLNKVAELQGVSVLNINELSNALKPIVLPGEEMEVKVIKEGKEYGQGVAYLDDGTMIVVDHGKKHIGEEIDVLVTSILQTAAGRMIFAKPKALEQVL